MSKNYGPKGFEKAFKKALKGFNETKIFFHKTGSQTIIQYIAEDKLLGIKMYHAQFEIDRWLNHFQDYLDTGKFDTNAYWVKYTTVRDDKGELNSTYEKNVTAIPMMLKDKYWSEHSPEFNTFMKNERIMHGDLGFQVVSKPLLELNDV